MPFSLWVMHAFYIYNCWIKKWFYIYRLKFNIQFILQKKLGIYILLFSLLWAMIISLNYLISKRNGLCIFYFAVILKIYQYLVKPFIFHYLIHHSSVFTNCQIIKNQIKAKFWFKILWRNNNSNWIFFALCLYASLNTYLF